MILELLILLFCFLSLIFSSMIIIARNPIHSILYLILVFCCVTFVLIILGIEFIAITFLIVYVGAIAVLFLFVVMMLNIKILELDETFWKYLPVGLIISCIFLLQIFYLIFDWSFFDFSLNDYYSIKELIFSNDSLYSNFYLISFERFETDIINVSIEATNTEMLGWLIYTYTAYIFFIVSLILLLAMIGSIVLVLNQNVNVKRQLIFQQTLRDLKTSVVLMK